MTTSPWQLCWARPFWVQRPAWAIPHFTPKVNPDQKIASPLKSLSGVAHKLSVTEAKAIICLAKTRQLAHDAVRVASSNASILCWGQGREDLPTLFNSFDEINSPEPVEVNAERDLGLMFWSSGTTGARDASICHCNTIAVFLALPKGICHSHAMAMYYVPLQPAFKASLPFICCNSLIQCTLCALCGWQLDRSRCPGWHEEVEGRTGRQLLLRCKATPLVETRELSCVHTRSHSSRWASLVESFALLLNPGCRRPTTRRHKAQLSLSSPSADTCLHDGYELT